MASWTEKLRPASFRGVGFEVDSLEGEGGRRVQIHEFPQRDEPLAEDLGRRARGFAIEAFLHGADFMVQLDKLLTALETAGPGELIHPLHGTLQVQVEEYRYRVERGEGRYVAVSIGLHEVGERKYPSAAADTQLASLNAADRGELAETDAFGRVFNMQGLPDWSYDQVGSALFGGLDRVSTAFGQVQSAVSAGIAVLKGDWQRLLPSELAGRVFGLVGQVRTLAMPLRAGESSGDGVMQSAPVRSDPVSVTPVSLIAARPEPLLPAAVTGSEVEDRTAVNVAAVTALLDVAVTVEAVRLAAVLPWPISDDAEAASNAVADALDDLAGRVDGQRYRPVVQLRIAAVKDLGERARNGIPLGEYRAQACQPSLVIAHRLYRDAARAGEIVDRNRVVNPLRVPPVLLKVLSR
ncbi:DNA circularization protein [Jeongeupia sp. USM3]|uniref:DNA circularization protein n=1 Tax=Jeongeupia sp. USM3 TaxID=1906741 RepID=UPI00089DDFE8|nr:DNA circularization N-terminal domain-containing protein [Jeongeupia sp. USM3]AOY00097.1 hypothetical protein BJP62_06315 [Jeongeupia sp. USM3]